MVEEGRAPCYRQCSPQRAAPARHSLGSAGVAAAPPGCPQSRQSDSSCTSLALNCPSQKVCQQVPTALGFLCPQSVEGRGSARGCAGAVTTIALLAVGWEQQGDSEGTGALCVARSPGCAWPCPQREELCGALLLAALTVHSSPVLQAPGSRLCFPCPTAGCALRW